jgi:hypothetical protein
LGSANQQVCQEWLEPERTMVFVAMDSLQHRVSCHHGRPGEAEMQLSALAISAFEFGINLTFEGQTAALAKGCPDPSHPRLAVFADETLARSSPLLTAKLTDLREKEA